MQPLSTLFRQMAAGACAVLAACSLGPARAEPPSASDICPDPTHAHAVAASALDFGWSMATNRRRLQSHSSR